ncbi:MAG: hypothetical protein CMJ46_16140 [Planctomyces sp.]|nr:hypothetical protein [Planctomyces sp.]
MTKKTLAQLTARQSQVLSYIRDHVTREGFAPTVREIGRHFGFRSPNGVMCHLRALEKKGYIHRRPQCSRAIQLPELGGMLAYRGEIG